MIKSRLLVALVAGGVAAAASSQDADSVDKCDPLKAHRVPAIAFTSTRDGNGEIYVMLTNEDGTVIDTVNPIRVTDNDVGDAFPQLSPDGKKIVFDSNRDIPGLPTHISDLFIMKSDANDQRRLTRGSSGTWSPDGKYIAFHRSASGDTCPLEPPPLPGTPGCPIKVDPGAATFDSDIFVMRVPDLDADVIDESMTNITNSEAYIDDDADWSPDGQKIVYTRHGVNDNHMNSTTAEICVLTLGDPIGVQCYLGDNGEEERAPTWSPDGAHIAYMCRSGIRGGNAFEICVINADGTGRVQLTDNGWFEATGSWSLDGSKIVFQRLLSGEQQLWIMNADGTSDPIQLTSPPGWNLFPKWGYVRSQ